MFRGEIKDLNQLLRLKEIAFRYDLVNWQVDKELDELGVCFGFGFSGGAPLKHTQVNLILAKSRNQHCLL